MEGSSVRPAGKAGVTLKFVTVPCTLGVTVTAGLLTANISGLGYTSAVGAERRTVIVRLKVDWPPALDAVIT